MTPQHSLLAFITALAAAAGIILLLRSLRRRWQSKRRTGQRSAHTPESSAQALLKRPESARTAFLLNIHLFAPLLPQLLNNHINASQWNNAIRAADNPELTAYGRKANGKPGLWIKTLNMWGISHDRRSVVTATDGTSSFYRTSTGENLIPGAKYIVKTPYWTLTDSTGTTLILHGTACRVKNSK